MTPADLIPALTAITAGMIAAVFAWWLADRRVAVQATLASRATMRAALAEDGEERALAARDAAQDALAAADAAHRATAVRLEQVGRTLALTQAALTKATVRAKQAEREAEWLRQTGTRGVTQLADLLDHERAITRQQAEQIATLTAERDGALDDAAELRGKLQRFQRVHGPDGRIVGRAA